MCCTVLLSCSVAWTDKHAPSAVLGGHHIQSVKISKNLLFAVWFPHAVASRFTLLWRPHRRPASVSSSEDWNSPGSLHLPQNLPHFPSLSLSLRYSPASLWLKHDPWCVTTLYPLPLYPLVVYLYPQRAINPQVKVLPFSPINLPSWATLHRNSKVSAGRRLVYLWDDESRLVFSHNTFNVLMISLPWVK